MMDVIRTELAASFAGTPFAAVLFRLASAACLGAILGWERESRDKPAGLRTHILIAVAACVFTLIAFDLMALDEKTARGALRVDPIRVIEAVTAGVAFLAAGSIITRGPNVTGLTTGAGMWMAGAVGLACGVGNVPLAALATAIAVAVMWLLRAFEPSADDGKD